MAYKYTSPIREQVGSPWTVALNPTYFHLWEQLDKTEPNGARTPFPKDILQVLQSWCNQTKALPLIDNLIIEWLVE